MNFEVWLLFKTVVSCVSSSLVEIFSHMSVAVWIQSRVVIATCYEPTLITTKALIICIHCQIQKTPSNMASMSNAWHRKKHDCILLLHCVSILLLVACYARMSCMKPLLSGKTAAVWSSCLWSCLNVANHRSFNNQQWVPALCESVQRVWTNAHACRESYLCILHEKLGGVPGYYKGKSFHNPHDLEELSQ